MSGRHRFAASVAVLLGALMLAACEPLRQPVAAIMPPPLDPASTERRIEAMKDDVVERLAQCESGGQAIVSRNGLYYGALQFHRGTVVAYYRSLYGREIGLAEATQIALDTPRALQLGKDIIFRSGSKLRDWPACSRKLGLASEVDRILAMER